MFHHRRNLLKQPCRVCVSQPPCRANVGVQVTVVPRKERVDARRSYDHLLKLDDTIVQTQPEVWRQCLLVSIQWQHLHIQQTTNSFSKCDAIMIITINVHLECT